MTLLPKDVTLLTKEIEDALDAGRLPDLPLKMPPQALEPARVLSQLFRAWGAMAKQTGDSARA